MRVMEKLFGRMFYGFRRAIEPRNRISPKLRISRNSHFRHIIFRHFVKSVCTVVKNVKNHEPFVRNTFSYLLSFWHKSRRKGTGGISDGPGGTSGREIPFIFQSPSGVLLSPTGGTSGREIPFIFPSPSGVLLSPTGGTSGREIPFIFPSTSGVLLSPTGGTSGREIPFIFPSTSGVLLSPTGGTSVREIPFIFPSPSGVLLSPTGSYNFPSPTAACCFRLRARNMKFRSRRVAFADARFLRSGDSLYFSKSQRRVAFADGLVYFSKSHSGVLLSTTSEKYEIPLAACCFRRRKKNGARVGSRLTDKTNPQAEG